MLKNYLPSFDSIKKLEKVHYQSLIPALFY